MLKFYAKIFRKLKTNLSYAMSFERGRISSLPWKKLEKFFEKNVDQKAKIL